MCGKKISVRKVLNVINNEKHLFEQMIVIQEMQIQVATQIVSRENKKKAYRSKTHKMQFFYANEGLLARLAGIS